MIQAKVLPDVLGQIAHDGISAVILMTSDGALLGSIGSIPNVGNKVIGAIVSNIWGDYQRAGNSVFPNDKLSFLLVDLEEGRLGVTAAGKGYVVCAYTTGEAQTGYMKTKLLSLGSYLEESLSKITFS